MNFLKDIESRDELLSILNASIDKILYPDKQFKTSTISPSELDSIASIFTQYCSNQLTKSEMLDYFPIKPEFKDCVFKAVEERKLTICKHLINLHNSRNCPLMSSFDWDIKLIMGNSSLSSHRSVKASLTLNCQCNEKSENVSIEMSRNVLEEMIKALENCNAVNST